MAGSNGRERDLDEALDRGVRTELPPNRPQGLLGESSPDLLKADDFEPDMNAGISQENDLPVVWLGVILSYLLFFPLAYVILWRSRYFTLRAKVIASIVGAAGVALVAWQLGVG